jgi:hypothetical protein
LNLTTTNNVPHETQRDRSSETQREREREREIHTQKLCFDNKKLENGCLFLLASPKIEMLEVLIEVLNHENKKQVQHIAVFSVQSQPSSQKQGGF